MPQYYTLEQAAQLLRTTPEKVKELARQNKIRTFQDRGTLRFRAPEIDELARTEGMASDPDLQLGEATPPRSGPPSSKKLTQAAPDPGVFQFEDSSEEVALGQGPPSSKSQRGSGPRRAGPPSSGPKSPAPKASSDSDVRLVPDGSDLDFQVAGDESPKSSKGPASTSPRSGKTKARQGTPKKGDSGARIVPLDEPSDSDVKIPADNSDEDVVLGERGPKSPSDSAVRLEEARRSKAPGKGTPPRQEESMVTEEIDLDAETRKAQEESRAKPNRPRPAAKSKPAGLPTSSPFELSESDVDLPPATGPKTTPGRGTAGDSSDDFELSLGGDESPLDSGSGESPLLTDDDEVSLGELTGSGRGRSGINLQNPEDGGISLEQDGSDEIDFELSLDAGATPRPAPASSTPDSSSEFELSLDDDAVQTQGDDAGSDSEFELSLDAPEGEDLAPAQSEGDSDSEFELTLDESGGLSPADEDESGEEKDIFESDFEVPALDEESGSEAVALEESDADLESSSDFDLELGEEGGEESGSAVVSLDEEEEADEGAATVARPRRAPARKKPVAEDEAPAEDFEAEEEPGAEEEAEAEGEEEEEPDLALVAEAAPAEWGALPAAVLIPCVLVLLIVGLMSFELVQGMWGYHKPGKVSRMVIDPIARMWDDTLPKD